jgi:hypothetical protein
MKALFILAAIFLVTPATAEAKVPIELLCHTQRLQCYKDSGNADECWNFDKPKWLFNLKTFLGKSRQEQSYVIDEAKGDIQINGFSYSTQPERGGTTKRYVDLKILPSDITLQIMSYQGCGYGENCQVQTHERITINRMNGELLRELISTDGSIKEVPLGQDYSQYFGYCDSDIKRQF